MKRNRYIFGLAVVAALCISAFIFGFFGLTTQYGDTKNIIIKKPENITYDTDLSGSTVLTFTTVDGSELSRADLNRTRDVLARRMEFIQVPSYDINIDYTHSTVYVQLPFSYPDDYEIIAEIAQKIGEIGEVYIKTAEGEAYVVSTENVKSASITTEEIMYLYTAASVKIVLDEEGTRLLTNTTNELVKEYNETGTAGSLSLWYADASVGTFAITDTAIHSGRITFSAIYGMEENTQMELGMYLNSGVLPAQLMYTEVAAKKANIGNDTLKILGIALMTAFAAIFIFLIIRFGLVGIAGIISILGTAGVTMFFITGFFIWEGQPGTLATLAALILTLLLSLETVMRSGQAIKDGFSTSSFDKSISQGLRLTFWSNFKLYIMILLLSIVMLLCGFNGVFTSVIRSIGIPYTGVLAIGNMGLVLVCGLFASFLFTLFGFRIMTSLLARLVDKSELFGGEKA